MTREETLAMAAAMLRPAGSAPTYTGSPSGSGGYSYNDLREAVGIAPVADEDADFARKIAQIGASVASGSPTASELNWWERYQASGSPTSRDDMLTTTEYNAVKQYMQGSVNQARPVIEGIDSNTFDIGNVDYGVNSGVWTDGVVDPSDFYGLAPGGETIPVGGARPGGGNPYTDPTTGNTGGTTGGTAGGGTAGGGTGGIGAPIVPNDRPDLPVPEGGPVTPWVPGENVDTSWNWDAFAPKREGDGAWGGYDADYQAFERYQPGMDSPWGMPDVMGGNNAFYQQQFVNLLRDEQGYRNRQRDAQRLAQEAADNPIEAPPIDWSWANNNQGLKDVTLGTGQASPTSWAFNDQYAGQSGADLWNQFRDYDVFTAPNESSKTTRDVLNNLFSEQPRADALNLDWSQYSNPNEAYQAIDPAAFSGMNRPNVAQQGVRTLLNQIYDVTGTGGPTAPPGYANPI